MDVDALTNGVLLSNVLPFLNRSDWNSFCLASTKIYNAVMKESPVLVPPWPDHCTLMHHHYVYSCPKWSPDGRQIAFYQNYGERVLIFDCQKGLLGRESDVVDHLRHDNAYINSLAYSPDGKFFVTASEDGIIKTWNVKENYKLVRQWKIFDHDDDDEVASVQVVVSPCSTKIAALHWKEVLVLGIDSEEDGDVPLQACKLPRQFGDCSNILFSPGDGSNIVFGGGDWTASSGQIKIWNLKTNDMVSIPSKPAATATAPDDEDDSDDSIRWIDISPNGSKLLTITMSPNSRVRIWDLDFNNNIINNNNNNINRDDGGDGKGSMMLSYSHSLPPKRGTEVVGFGGGEDVSECAMFAPNGEDILTGKYNRYMVCKIDGSQPRVFFGGGGATTTTTNFINLDRVDGIDFSPNHNGKQLFVMTQNHSIEIHRFYGSSSKEEEIMTIKVNNTNNINNNRQQTILRRRRQDGPSSSYGTPRSQWHRDDDDSDAETTTLKNNNDFAAATTTFCRALLLLSALASNTTKKNRCSTTTTMIVVVVGVAFAVAAIMIH